MTAFTPPDDLWAHKAHALLLPTPLAAPSAEPFADPALDPAEAARAAEIRELLHKHGLGVRDWTPDLEQLHRDAHRDAYNTHVHGAPVDGARAGLRHPLSGAHLTPPRTFTAEQWPDFLRHLDTTLTAPADPRARYRALWRILMRRNDSFGLDGLPGHAIFNDHTLIAHRSAAAALVGARLGGDRAALLHLHLGPVQSFIAAARRTHDLALGSYTVAYLSFHAVQSIADALGPDAILYPDLATLPLYDLRTGLSPSERLKQACKALRASLPNRFMAIVPEPHAESIAKKAAQSVAQTWNAIADKVFNYLKPSAPLRPADENRFEAQIRAHLEMDATFAPLDPSSSDPPYPKLFKTARDDLTAQRRLITALPPAGAEVPKCSQCGEREQLGEDREFWRQLRSSLAKRSGGSNPSDDSEKPETIDLRDGEALCAVCLTKRFANRAYFGDPHASLLNLSWDDSGDRPLLRFPSVASVASAPVRHLLHIHRGHVDASISDWNADLKNCHRALHFTEPGNLLPGLASIGRTGQMYLDVDGTWYYDTSYELDTALRDHDLVRDDVDEAKRDDLTRTLHQARKRLSSLLSEIGAAPKSLHVTPYYALLSLDVDRMGQWLDGSHEKTLTYEKFPGAPGDPDTVRKITPALHHEISRRQSHLASDPIYKIVERDNLGRVVYSGGDDLLAFVPLATVWRCLDALCQLFKSNTDGLGNSVTVSAGVAISHWRAPLGQALHHAREAEKAAKKTRDSLVVTVDKRSGVPLTCALDWSVPKLLQQPGLFADLTDDRPDTDDRAPSTSPPLRLNTLERLERELDQLGTTPAEAIRARVFPHLTGKRRAELVPFPDGTLLAHLDKLCDPHRRSELLAFLHLLRFLAREHDPVLAELFPPPPRSEER